MFAGIRFASAVACTSHVRLLSSLVVKDVDPAKVETACKSVNCEAVAPVVTVVEEVGFS